MIGNAVLVLLSLTVTLVEAVNETHADAFLYFTVSVPVS